jgi:hypothetical protein
MASMLASVACATSPPLSTEKPSMSNYRQQVVDLLKSSAHVLQFTPSPDGKASLLTRQLAHLRGFVGKAGSK